MGGQSVLGEQIETGRDQRPGRTTEWLDSDGDQDFQLRSLILGVCFLFQCGQGPYMLVLVTFED